MLQLFDTHAHFTPDSHATAASIKRAAEAGVVSIVAVGGNPLLNKAAITARDLAPQQIKLALGLDREEALTADAIRRVDALFSDPPRALAAIGEIGLDYHYHSSDSARSQQRHLMEYQLAIANRLRLPVIIHTRSAAADTLALLRSAAALPWFQDKRPGVIHCYTGDLAFAHDLMELGYYISFSGIVTFNAAHELRSVAREIPLERLLLETDSPYLAPVPLRGKPNEPAYLPHIVTLMAKLRSLEPQQIAALTTANAHQLFQ